MPTTDEVFGVSRDLPLNYVTRPEVDDKFIECLSRKQHIVIYGSSKQGKTSLRKKCLLEGDYIVVSCQNRWTLGVLQATILKECGFEVKESEERAATGVHKVIAGVEAKGGIPLLAEGGGRSEYEHQNETTDRTVYTPLELDPTDTNDIIRALKSIEFNKYIVLEDFHYLPDETQRDFSFSLKTFHESSEISFIVVGVWREKNRLISFNGDLTDRVLSVDVDTWRHDSLKAVMIAGASLLNIDFDDQFAETLLKNCFDSVHIVQECCRQACRTSGVYGKTDSKTRVGENIDVLSLIRDVVSEQAGRYRGFLMGFADGFQETDLQMPKWIVYAILCSNAEELEKGIRLRKVSRLIKTKHPKGKNLNNGNITQALNFASSLQNKKSIRPLVIDYDAANTNLYVVDRGFLIWLKSQDVGELLEDLGLPERVDITT